MNSSMLTVLNSLFHSRKFQAYALSLIIAILVPLVNKWAGLSLDPQVVTGLVLGSIGGGAAYGLATAHEDGKKAMANATLAAAPFGFVPDTIQKPGDLPTSVQGLGGFGSFLGGAGVDIGVTIAATTFLTRIKGQKKQAQIRDVAAHTVKEILDIYSGDEEFLRKAGLK
jgi:hypothetical protein